MFSTGPGVWHSGGMKQRHARRRPRRLTDKLLQAFHAACNEDAAEIAQELLRLLLFHVQHPAHLPAGFERRAPHDFKGARERLRNLQR